MDRDEFGRQHLHYYALENDLPKVRDLLIKGVNPNVADNDGFTPLHFAAQQWAVEAADLLLQHGAYVDATNCHGNTPLWTAVFNSKGRGEMIALLRRYGADPYHANNYDHTPVSAARSIANYDVAQYFADLPPD
jgi:ankyrin repeat protein